MSNINEVCAVILAGGLSSRMGGGNKTLKKFNNKLIFDRIFENIKSQLRDVIVNSNDSENLFSKYHNLKIVPDSLKGFLGPLAGIHASLEWLVVNKKNFNWLISIPGDTPFIPKNLVKKLLEKANNNNLKIVLAKSKGKVHPAIGIWHISLYKNLEENLVLGTRKILDWALKQSLGYVEFKNSKYDPFFNINYEKDIYQAVEIENNYL